MTKTCRNDHGYTLSPHCPVVMVTVGGLWILVSFLKMFFAFVVKLTNWLFNYENVIDFPLSSGEEQNKEALQDVEDETQQ